MPMMNLRVIAPDHLIDINRVAEPRRDSATAVDGIEIGAMTRQADVLASDLVKSRLPLLTRALEHVGHIQTRARGTIGGSCCHLDPSAEQPAMCAALDAEFVVVGPGGRRVIPAGEWFEGLLQSALGEQEFLEAIRFKPWADGHGYGFAEYARRHGDFAIAGGAALLEAGRDGRITRAALLSFGVEAAPKRLVRGGTHADRPARRQSRHQTRRCRSQRARCNGRRPCDRRLSASSGRRADPPGVERGLHHHASGRHDRTIP